MRLRKFFSLVLTTLSSKTDTLAETASGAAPSDEATETCSRDDPSGGVVGAAGGAADALCEAEEADWRVTEPVACAAAMSSSLDVAASSLKK